VNALSEEAKAFYLLLGLDASSLDPMTLMVTLADLRAALEWLGLRAGEIRRMSWSQKFTEETLEVEARRPSDQRLARRVGDLISPRSCSGRSIFMRLTAVIYRSMQSRIH
jgi:hypothetical protein